MVTTSDDGSFQEEANWEYDTANEDEGMEDRRSDQTDEERLDRVLPPAGRMRSPAQPGGLMKPSWHGTAA